ncbi:MAG: hypothetical protein ACTSWX_03290 [Promethearchaeota archaeon]
MEEENSDKKSEIDWESTYDEQLTNARPEYTGTSVIQEKQKKMDVKESKSSKKKTFIIFEIVILILTFIIFVNTHNPGLILIGLILSICIWQFRKKPKKKPYEYLYEEKEQKKGESEVQKGLPSYMPNTRFDQAYIPSYGIPAPDQTALLETEHSKTKIYKEFQKAAEYNTSWLDSKTQTLNVDPDDEIILSHWTPLRISLKTSIGDSTKNFLMLMVYFGIYALISFFIWDRGTGKLDYTIQALFFPIVPYVLVCYRGFDKYIKAILFSLLLMSTVITTLFNLHIITALGIPFLKYFAFLKDNFPSMFDFLINLSGIENEIKFTYILLGVVFVFEFILMILYSIVKTRPYVSMVITKKAIFIRAKTKKSFWDILVNIFWIILNPFNVKQYKDIQDRIRYNRLTAKEGKYHDFSKITPSATQSLKKKKYNSKLLKAISIITLITGFISFFFINIFSLIIIGIGIILLINSSKKKNKYKIIIDVNRSQVEGSWILSHKSDILVFERVPESIAKFFVPLKKLP